MDIAGCSVRPIAVNVKDGLSTVLDQLPRRGDRVYWYRNGPSLDTLLSESYFDERIKVRGDNWSTNTAVKAREKTSKASVALGYVPRPRMRKIPTLGFVSGGSGHLVTINVKGSAED